MNKSSTERQELRRFKLEFVQRVATLIISAFGLVAALAWNTAITKIIEQYIAVQPGSHVLSWVGYALIVTILAVFVTMYIGQWAERIHTSGENKKKG